MNKKKELKREYQQNHTPMGIYQIRNTANDKVFIGTALNLPGVLNGQKFQLSAGSHLNKRLQADWNEFGSESFTFEILDELSATEGPSHDYRADLAFLEEFWLETVQPYGERGYNEKKKDKEEMLRLIAQNRLSKQSK
ncbi:MAG: GIY-YIG nuclease family protein [Acidobacteriota bacterium]